MISCKDLRFSYTTDGESIVGLDGLSLKIVAGEYVAIMGPNGSGKSTLARVISGIMPQDEGEYFFDGVSAKSPDGSRLIMENIGIVFQNPDNQMVAMTVESEIAFPLENKNISPSIIREKVNQIVEIFGLKELLKRPPQMLSGGERQKVLIASVLTCEPICLIFDEPTSLLDPNGRKQILELLGEIHTGVGAFPSPQRDSHAKPTIIHITQFADEALQAERIIVLDKGKVAYDGTPEAIFHRLYRENKVLISLPSLLKARWAETLGKKPVLPQDEPLAMIDSSKNESGFDFTDVKFIYKLSWGEDITALERATFEIPLNSVTGLMGATGSGKSSAARIMSFLAFPDEGAFNYKGMTVSRSSLSKLRKQVSLAFQFPERQFFCENVYDELAFGLRLRGVDETTITDIIMKSLELVGLEYDRFAARDPFTLSGGEKRRVGIAINLALDPEVIILDEPTSGMDGEGLVYLRKLIMALKLKGKTIVVISHNQEFILSICDKIIFFNKAKIVGQVAVSEILSGDSVISKHYLLLTPYVEYIIKKARALGILLRYLPIPD